MLFLAAEDAPGQELVTADEPPARAMSTAEFRAKQFIHLLTPDQRAAVARRSRFYSIPWIVPAGQDDTDQLP